IPAKVDVIVNSGMPEEFVRSGEVLGVDRDNDLAIIRVAGDAAGLPPPLPVDESSNLSELQKVYIYGFPYGKTLGKDITLSESAISSFRRNPEGLIQKIQVNGGMEPGNSGGPVVDARGVVIGVSVSIIKGTQINFAVPGEKVQAMLRGRIAGIQI